MPSLFHPSTLIGQDEENLVKLVNLDVNLVLLIHHLLSIEEGMILNNIVWILFLMSNISDAIIYMFTQPEVKKTLRKKLNYVRSLYQRSGMDTQESNDLKTDIEMNSAVV